MKLALCTQVQYCHDKTSLVFNSSEGKLYCYGRQRSLRQLSGKELHVGVKVICPYTSDHIVQICSWSKSSHVIYVKYPVYTGTVVRLYISLPKSNILCTLYVEEFQLFELQIQSRRQSVLPHPSSLIAENCSSVQFFNNLFSL